MKSVRKKIRLHWGPLLLASLVASMAAGGCQLIAGLTGSYTLEPSSDAGPGDDGSSGDDGGPTTGCQSVEPPGPPPASDGGGPISFVAAVHTIDLGDMGDTPGYDLDRVCTCYDGGPPSCISASTHCDVTGPGGTGSTGIDNEAAQFLGVLQLADSNANLHSSNLDKTANAGGWSLLVHVTNYNGEPDDFAVNVALYPSGGLGSTPAWDGSDAWPVEPSSVGPGGIDDPLYTSLGAYVSGGVLVAGLPSVAILLTGGTTFSVSLVGGVLTGKLVKGSDGWKITNGIVAGRWPTQAVFQTLGSLQFDGSPLCTDSPVFGMAKSAICEAADILANASDPPTVPCDSISFGFGFTADPAMIGGVAPPKTIDGGCPPATDPSGTTCN